jgi:hypothetical protein
MRALRSSCVIYHWPFAQRSFALSSQMKYITEKNLLGTSSLQAFDTHKSYYDVRGHKLAPDGQIRNKAGYKDPAYPPTVGKTYEEDGTENEGKKTSAPADVIFEFKTSLNSDPFTDIDRDGATILQLDIAKLSQQKQQVLG